MVLRNAVVAAVVVLTLSACATDDPNRRAKMGAAAGAVLGAVLGHQVNGKNGKYVGALLGAIAGGVAGTYMDKQQKELDDALAAEQQDGAVTIERLADNTVRLRLSSDVSFDSNKSSLKPSFEPTLNKLATVLGKYDSTVIHVVGFADSRGKESYNLDLSKRRSNSVVNYLAGRGLPSDRLRVEGRGEAQPIADNGSATGRSQNRRVEVYLKPVIEGQENQAYRSPV